MNILGVGDVTKEQVNQIFDLADKAQADTTSEPLKNKVLAMLFTLPSTRTRISLSVAITQLGGSAVYIDTQSSQMKRGETIADTARMISSYCQFIAVRTEDHALLQEIAANSKVPVINALTMREHPTQALADLYTVSKRKSLAGLRIAFVGDTAQNTANSLMLLATMLGAEVNLVGPKGFEPNPEFLQKALALGSVNVFDSVEEGMKGVDVIYTDTFVSMGDEAEAKKRRALFAPYQVNAKMLSYARPDVLVMHPLPAHREEEITSDVLDGPHSITWEQAHNKLTVAKAVLLFLSQSH